MAWDTRSGFCLTSGPPGPAAPYAPQMCFQTAYVAEPSVNPLAFSREAMGCQKFATSRGNGLSTVANGQMVGACQYPEECGAGYTCNAGKCVPVDQVHSPWAYVNSNPKIVSDVAWSHVAQMMQAMNMTEQFKEFASQYAFGQTMFIVHYRGQESLAVPINVQYFRQDPQCSTCLKSVWQCDRFAEAAAAGDPQAKELYSSCLQFRDCFLYDTMRPDGVIIPLMIKVDPVSFQVAKAALQKCVMHCGDCVPNDPLARGEPGLFH